MTSLLRRQLEASLELENDPGVRTFRSINKRIRPDPSNTSDVDVCGWLQSIETYAREFHDEYAEAKSHRAYDRIAPDLVYHVKMAIITIQDMQKAAGTDV